MSYAKANPFGGGSGSGNVQGPATSTDDALVRFKGTTGKIIQNSAVTVDDSGNISTSGTVNGVTAAEFGYLDATSSIQTQIDSKQATVTGGASTVTGADLAVLRALSSDASGKIAVSSVTSTELGHVSGVTSAIQTQLDAKQVTVTGAASTITTANLGSTRALVSDGSGKVAVSAVTSTELGYVSGVSSDIQTQLDAKLDDSQKGAANGLAELDSSSKVPVAQLPDAVLGALQYQGTWNATTNTPSLSNGSGTQGHYYVVSTAGTTNLDGITDWEIGDWVVADNAAWQKVDNSDKVSSVAGRTGVVTLDLDDVDNGGSLTNVTLNTSVSGTAILDEDNMASDSATQLATQQSIKAYVDTGIAAVASVTVTYSDKSADYTITDVDGIRTIGMTTGAADKTVTLPTASDNTDRIITVKKVDSGAGDVIIDGEGAETIDGSATRTLAIIYDSLTVQCDGTGWVILDYSALATATQSGLVKKNKYIGDFSTTEDYAPNDASASSDYPSIDMRGELVVGAWYEAEVVAQIQHRDSANKQTLELYSGASGTGTRFATNSWGTPYGSSNASPMYENVTFTTIFQAVSIDLFLYARHEDNFAGFTSAGVRIFKRNDIE
jgi:hypothetical protein